MPAVVAAFAPVISQEKYGFPADQMGESACAFVFWPFSSLTSCWLPLLSPILRTQTQSMYTGMMQAMQALKALDDEDLKKEIQDVTEQYAEKPSE